MDALQIFHHLNGFLNLTSGLFLASGFFFILRKKIRAHRFCMLAATIISSIFVVSYLTHHALLTYAYGLGPTRFTGEGLARPIYFTILLSHTILAAGIGPFVIITLYHALKGNFAKHRKIARLVMPIWLYVSMTGFTVYMMLYHFYPGR